MTTTLTFPGAKISSAVRLPLWKDRVFKDWAYWLTPDYQPVDSGGVMNAADNAKGVLTNLKEEGTTPLWKVVNLGTSEAPNNVFDSRDAAPTARGWKVPNSVFNELTGFCLAAVLQVPASFAATGDLFGSRRFSSQSVGAATLIAGDTANRTVAGAARALTSVTTEQRTTAYGQWWSVILNVSAAADTMTFEAVDVTATTKALPGTSGATMGTYLDNEYGFRIGSRPTGSGSLLNPFVGRLKLFGIKRSFISDAAELEALRVRLRAERARVAAFTI